MRELLQSKYRKDLILLPLLAHLKDTSGCFRQRIRQNSPLNTGLTLGKWSSPVQSEFDSAVLLCFVSLTANTSFLTEDKYDHESTEQEGNCRAPLISETSKKAKHKPELVHSEDKKKD